MIATTRNFASSIAPKRRLLLTSDRGRHGADLLLVLYDIADVETVPLAHLPDAPHPGLCGVVVDIDLRSLDSVQLARRKFAGSNYQSLPRLFVLTNDLHHSSMQAWALGATDTIMRPLDARAIQARIRAAFPDSAETARLSNAEAMTSGIVAAEEVLTKIFDRLPAEQALSYKDIVQAEGAILQAIKRTSLRDWLDAIRRRHNESYRLILFTTGYAVAFAQHLGMREEDQRRLIRAALLYDTGKSFTDARLLDDADRLTGDDLLQYRQHPRLGFEALAREGSIPPETLDVVLHHHELLDGSGYPDALQSDQISDIVRLITIFDLFTSLIAERANHIPMPPFEAFSRLEAMGDKIDQRLLQAFRPVALKG